MTTAQVALVPADPEKWTERRVLDLLRKRHATQNGNGPEWAYLEHVRDAAGFDAKRTIDALALHLWPSRGHEMHAFEVKVSRADWRRELAQPEKADGWCRVADRFWIVAPRGVVPAEEIPATWGLLETRGSGLSASVPAPLLRPKQERTSIDRGLLACLLRAAGAGLSKTPEQEAIDAAEARGREAGRAHAVREIESLTASRDQWAEQGRVARDAVGEFEKILGVRLNAWGARDSARVQAVAKQLRAVLAGDSAVAEAEQRLERAAADLEQAARWLRESAGRAS